MTAASGNRCSYLNIRLKTWKLNIPFSLVDASMMPKSKHKP